MKDQYVKKEILSIEECCLGFMRYAQVCHGASSFPRFPGPAWERFFLWVDKELGHLFAQSLDLEFDWDGGLMIRDCDDLSFALNVTTIVDDDPYRMRLDVAENEWGKELGEQFPELAEKMFKLSLEIRGFVYF